MMKFIQEKRLTLDDYVFPDGAMALAYVVAALPVAVIFGYLLVGVIIRAKQGGLEVGLVLSYY